MKHKNADEEACDREVRLFFALVFGVGGIAALAGIIVLVRAVISS